MIRHLTIAPRHLALILPAYLVFVAFNFILRTLGDGGMEIGPVTLVPEARVVEATGRYRVITAAMFDVAVTLAILVIFAVNLWAAFARSVWLWTGVVLVTGAAIGIGASLVAPHWAAGVDFPDLLDNGFFLDALAAGRVTLCEAGIADCGGLGAAWVQEVLTAPINVLTSLAAPLVLWGMVLGLADHGDALTPHGLKRAHEILQRYLYLSGLLLSSGMMFLISWMKWPGHLISEASAQAAYMDLVGALTLATGTGFTLMILVTYLPVMLILRLRTEAVGRDNVPAEDIPAATYTDGLKTVVAILSPILAGALGGFGNGLSFG